MSLGVDWRYSPVSPYVASEPDTTTGSPNGLYAILARRSPADPLVTTRTFPRWSADVAVMVATPADASSVQVRKTISMNPRLAVTSRPTWTSGTGADASPPGAVGLPGPSPP